ncbi:hypothetical protein NX014_06315 [Vibrio vulnificus]|uniref:hypothetical protein n=1 Tax=Vibrio vulnificus TaxID=672 RepID=UPI0028E07053|nr:hypothetical protein [Vibrio vulnificus]MDT8823876.1 hypothetical protein [Vibrio vulnificus]
MKHSKSYFILTSDGSRKTELIKLLDSVKNVRNIYFIFVNQSENAWYLSDEFDSRKIEYFTINANRVIPLSEARNLALDYLDSILMPEDFDNVIFSDDDCYYSPGYCSYLDSEKITDLHQMTIPVFPVLSPDDGSYFTSKGVKKISFIKELATSDIMFYTCSISFILPYKIVKSNRFNSNIGLGNEVNQGEESDFLERIISKFPLSFIYLPEIPIYHPRKTDYPVKVFYSMSYFLSHKLVSSGNKKLYLKYACFFYLKYCFFSLFIFWNAKYRKIFRQSVLGAIDGIADIKGCFK